MIERRVKAFLVVSSLVGAGVVAALTPAAAQGRGTSASSGDANNTVANLVVPFAALAYGAYWLAAGIRHHWITIPHRVGHPYAIPPKPNAREESAGPKGEEGEEKGDGGK